MYISDLGIGNDLSGLENLATIDGELVIYSISMASLSPLDGLVSIGTSITITLENDQIAWVDIFPNVTSSIIELTINQNASASISGFNAIQAVGDLYMYTGFEAAQSFDGFHNLQSVQFFYMDDSFYSVFSGFENLIIADMLNLGFNCECDMLDFPSLTSVNNISIMGGASSTPSFPALLTIPGDIQIIGYPDTIRFDALQNVGGNIMIAGDFGAGSNGDVIFDLQMNELLTVGGDFMIYSTQLTELGCDNLQLVGGLICIDFNPSMTSCTAQALCDKILANPEMVSITYNAPGDCESVEAVAATCLLDFSYSTGTFYADMDCDGAFNNADVVVPNLTVLDQNNLPVGATYTDGSYFVALLDNVTTTLFVSPPAGFMPAPSHTITTTALNEVFADYDFPMCPIPNSNNLSVVAYHFNSPRPGFESTYVIVVKNLWPTPTQGLVTFDISAMPGASYLSSNPMGIVGGNTISWNTNMLNFQQTQWFYLYTDVSASTTLGTVFSPTVSVSLLPNTLLDVDQSNNTFTFTETVIGGYDPNDKTVNRTQVHIDEVAGDEGVMLNYTIRFQNTGTADAINIHVDDVIEEQLDLSTFEMVHASHPYQLTFDENRKLVWLFENIMLPDSSTNEAESHGVIHFRIKTVGNLLMTDSITNNCAIFFDINEPVITNSATTIFYQCPPELSIGGEQSICTTGELDIYGTLGWDTYTWYLNGEEFSTDWNLVWNDPMAGEYEMMLVATTTYCEASTTENILVTQMPEPVLVQNGNTITATNVTIGGFDWYLNDVLLEAENESSIEITASGYYEVNVYAFDCISPVVGGFFEYTSVEEFGSTSGMFIYPNPSDVGFTIQLLNETHADQLVITNSIGQVVIDKTINSKTLFIGHNGLSQGLYHASILNQGQQLADGVVMIR